MDLVKEEPNSSDMGIGMGMTGAFDLPAPPENVQWPPSNNIKELQTKPNLDCLICGKKFKFESAMKVHVKRAHLKIKDFHCDECDKSFTSKSNLTTHKQTHSGEKFPCHICGVQLARKINLINHMKSAHMEGAEKPYTIKQPPTEQIPCHICGKLFNHNRNYRLHFRRQHMEPKVKRVDVYTNDFKLEVLEKVKEVGVIAARKAYGVHENTIKG